MGNVLAMREALGAMLVGLLTLVAGLAARRTGSLALQTVGQVLVIGGAFVLLAAVGMVVLHIKHSRE